MNNTLSVKREMIRENGIVRLSYKSGKDTPFIAKKVLPLDALSWKDFYDLLDLDESTRSLFAKKSSVFAYRSGWQSWSSGWEFSPGERTRKAKVVWQFNEMVYVPFERRGGAKVNSHFVTYLRAGDTYLVLVSVNKGTAPVMFSVDRGARKLALGAYAHLKEYAPGETIADIAAFRAEGYFAFKDILRKLFAGFDHFARLGFLFSAEDVRLPPGGYESWYNHYSNINEKLILGDLDSIDANPNLINRYYIERKKPTVFQVDDGWQVGTGQWEANLDRFPAGMRALADKIKAKGLIPGLWIAPFLVTRFSRIFKEKNEWVLKDGSGKCVVAGWNPEWGKNYYCLDISRNDVCDYLFDVFDVMINDWGFRYLKLDFLYAGMLPGKFLNPGAPFEHYEKIISRITCVNKNAKGEPVAYLGCGAPLESSFRHFPLMRIGADTKEIWEFSLLKTLTHQGRPAAYVSLLNTVGRSFMDRTIFVNDPDVVFMRTQNMELTAKEKECIALSNYMLASQIMFSDDPCAFDAAGEKTFTDYSIDLFDRLACREFGARRLARDVYSVFSSDGVVTGVINLSDRPWDAPVSLTFDPKTAVVSRFVHDPVSGKTNFDAHSVSLFGDF